MSGGELTAQERAALALWLLLQGPMSTREIAERVGLSMDAARSMLYKVARVAPVKYDRRKWCVNGPKT